MDDDDLNLKNALSFPTFPKFKSYVKQNLSNIIDRIKKITALT